MRKVCKIFAQDFFRFLQQESKNSLRGWTRSSLIQMDKSLDNVSWSLNCRHCAVSRTNKPTIRKIVGLAHMPLICKSAFAVKTLMHLNQQEGVLSLILIFKGLPVNLANDIEKIRLDLVRCIIKRIRLFLSQRCRLFLIRLSFCYHYKFLQIWISTDPSCLKKQLCFSVKNQPFSLFGYLYW